MTPQNKDVHSQRRRERTLGINNSFGRVWSSQPVDKSLKREERELDVNPGEEISGEAQRYSI